MDDVKVGDRFEGMHDAGVTCEVIGFVGGGWARIEERRRPEVRTYISNSIMRSGLRGDQRSWRPLSLADGEAKPCPPYYIRAGIEAKDVVHAFDLTWATGSAVTYILRAGKKTADPRGDLMKARDMIDIELARLDSK